MKKIIGLIILIPCTAALTLIVFGFMLASREMKTFETEAEDIYGV